MRLFGRGLKQVVAQKELVPRVCLAVGIRREIAVSAINTWRHADLDLILLVRCLYFCLNFKNDFILL